MTAKYLRCVVFSVLLGLSLVSQAGADSLSAVIPWDGEGRVFRVSSEKVLFLGAFEGIIYVETNEGELDEGFVRCPVTQELSLADQTTSASGYCMITASGGDTVYAEWTCAGEVGGCRGDFNLTSGTGQFEGISGNSKLIVRSPLHALSVDLASGSVLRVASGIAMLPELRYKLSETQ